MNIAVYCGASLGNQNAYRDDAVKIGKWIAENDHTLIYGGGKAGLMGIIADTVLEHSGSVVGVMPDFLIKREIAHKGLTKMYETKTMTERKVK